MLESCVKLFAILKGALAIGRRADMLALKEVRTRLQAVQQRVPTLIMVVCSSKLTKFKAWFAPAA